MSQGTIPALYSTGNYTFTAPFNALVSGTKSLTCVAIRGFEELVADNVNAFTEFYEPNGLEQTDVTQAIRDKVVIVTFEDNVGNIFNVPSNYIGKLPNSDYVPYSHVVLSVSLGALPDELDLVNFQNGVQSKVAALLGATPVVAIHRAPVLTGEVITPATHASMESAREAAVTSRETLYAENERLHAQVLELQTKITAYETYIDSLP